MRRLKLFAPFRLQETQLLFKAVADAAERGWAGCKRWRGALSGVGWQIRIAGRVYFSLVPRIKSLRTPHKSGLGLEVKSWLG